MNQKKFIFGTVFIIAVVVALEILSSLFKHHEKINPIQIAGLYLTQPKNTNDFQLNATTEKVFDKKNLQGHWTFLFFGFTQCGQVCPTAMAALGGMYKILQGTLPDSQLPQVVMVSVDPERDTISRMREYVSAFDPHFIGARTDEKNTIALEKQLYIAAVKMQAAGQHKNQYTLNHTAEILLFNPAGQLQAYLNYPPAKEQLAKDYQLIIKTYSGLWPFSKWWAHTAHVFVGWAKATLLPCPP